MSQPKLSIITVSYNAKNTIEATIQSVLRQSFRDYEYIVIDGGSDDGTLEILRKYEADKRLRFISEPDSGVYFAMNKGVKLAKGEWIYFIGSDDILYNATVLDDVFEKAKDTKSEVIYGKVKFLHSGVIYAGFFDHEEISTKNICHQALFVKKTVFDKLGLFNTRYKMSADYEFNLRWMGLNIPSLYLDLVIAVFNEKGMSGQIWDKIFHYDFDDLLIKNNIISNKSFSELKRRHDSLSNSYRYKLGDQLVSPISWLRTKLIKRLWKM